ncbi:MAG: serine hydrolase [Cyanobacteria bacterium J06621_11]
MTATLTPNASTRMRLATNVSTESPLNQITEEKLTEIDAYLDAYAQTGRFSGTVFINQTDHAPIIRSYHFANQEHQVANTPITRFRIGSVTKQFTAVAILQLQEAGLLDLQAPITTYLPDYPEGNQLTIHQLLTHTAGIPEYLDPVAFPDLIEWIGQPTTVNQLVDRFKDLPLEFRPGEKFKYSNSGYVLLTQIIEVVSNQPYVDYLQANIFDPLKMNNTGYEVPQTVIPHLAQGYLFIGNDTYLQAVPLDMSIPQGAGGLYSTAADLTQWTQWLHDENADPTVLSSAGRTKLMSPVIQMTSDPAISEELASEELTPEDPTSENAPAKESPEIFYGYGIVIDHHFEQQRVQHNGGINGFASALAHYPQSAMTITVLSNLETAPSGRIAEDLAAIAFDQPYDLPKQREPIDLDPAIYEKYVGNYQLLPEMQVAIRVQDGELTAQATGQSAFVLYPTSETEFFAQVADITMTFSLTESGTAEGLTLYQLGQELFSPKIDQPN